MVMEEQQSDMELDSERIPVPQVQKLGTVETVNNVTNISRGKPRLRKKALHAAILAQIEFYFSDANLSKDRFLSNLIQQNPYVDLNVFLRFNKIQELTTDVNRITKALQASTMLSLSENGTKVHRITPIVPKENTDDCTVYVQNLPPDTDHERLKSLFSQYGPVVYVSLPRYRHNKKIKGFAFVEFDTPDSVKKCLKAFQKKGCVLPLHTAPNELLSITTFDTDEKNVIQKKRIINSSENNIYTTNTIKTEDLQNVENYEKGHATVDNTSEFHENEGKKKARKRKHKDTEMLQTDGMEKQIDAEVISKSRKKSSKSATDTCSDEKQSDISLDIIPADLIKQEEGISIKEEQTLDNGDDSEQMITENSATVAVEEQEDTSEKKKKRKRKRRSKTEDIGYNMQLQVIAKKDWKHLRNKYLELQRSKMKQLKQHLRKTRWNQWCNYEKIKPEKEENDEKEKATKENNENTQRFTFTPGVIVKIKLDTPCTDPKQFKMELKGNNCIKYVDVKEGSFLVYVRFDTSDAAQTFTQKSSEGQHPTILDGEEEKLYWNKITYDREEKLGKKVKTKQRGRTKLLKKAEKELGKHIKFDEV
ncbi:la-related protein 7 [Colletes gigas]|uniref:la-related protein 7 n=1 Tax=Colletes gigas TaxID=935657 RepID=UPI001C9AA42B|nr:la-related protein 7 [Colletes gigas]XP_043249302.1 la-related protein 7 [Colletes gigas]XP_043249303.1 la-related protein 7 [Colletes gigas]XP_043249304.1 la-related protein 7 [Colletes gigas]XP_043249305.1 la-related protein 7 [Colletes gigas]